MAKMILGYWDIRARAEPARMMFEYAGKEYEDRRYGFSEDKGPDWKKDKCSLDLDFPNLPYLIDGENRVTESWAIYRYLGRKLGLYPSTEKGEYESDMVAGVLDALLRGFVGTVFNPDIKNLLEKTKESQVPKIIQLDKFLAGRQFVTEDKLTYVDTVLYEFMDWHRLLLPDILDNTPNILAFMDRFASLERIAAYFGSKRYKKFPIYAPFAAWGGKDHDDKTW